MTGLRSQRIVVTGIGVVAPNGIGKDVFWQNCFDGISGIRPISLFDAHAYRCRCAGEVIDFTPEEHLGPKGLRTLDRTTRLALVAAQFALKDAALEVTPAGCQDIGVVLGCTMGSVRSISEFDVESLREGPRYVNPALFPNVVINSPASHIAIRFQLRGVNSTISTGFTAGLDAIGYALRLLQLRRVKAVLVGGVEELCLQTFLGFYRLGLLATEPTGRSPRYAPFHPQRQGTLLGEGAAILVLEPLEEAHRRRVPAYAELLGYGTSFHPDSAYRYDPASTASVTASRRALQEADVDAADIDFVSACANATRATDAMEVVSLKTLFGDRASRVPVSAVKSLIGESFSAGGALQVALALGAIARQQVPPSPAGDTNDFDLELNLVRERARSASVSTVLVQSIALTGSSSALVIGGV